MSVQQAAVARAVAMLKAAGAKYHVQFENAEWGEPVNPPKLAVTRAWKNRGIAAHTRPYLETLTEPGVVNVPVFNDDLVATQSSASSLAGLMWGPGNYLTQMCGDHVEVMRVV